MPRPQRLRLLPSPVQLDATGGGVRRDVTKPRAVLKVTRTDARALPHPPSDPTQSAPVASASAGALSSPFTPAARPQSSGG